MAKKTVKKAGLNPFVKMMSKEKKESRKEEKMEKYSNSKASKMDMKIDKMMNHKKGKK